MDIKISIDKNLYLFGLRFENRMVKVKAVYIFIEKPKIDFRL